VVLSVKVVNLLAKGPNLGDICSVGSLIRPVSGKSVFCIRKGGIRCRFNSGASFMAQGYSFENVVPVSDTIADAIPIQSQVC